MLYMIFPFALKNINTYYQYTYYAYVPRNSLNGCPGIIYLHISRPVGRYLYQSVGALTYWLFFSIQFGRITFIVKQWQFKRIGSLRDYR